jgi:hypothetical protein
MASVMRAFAMLCMLAGGCTISVDVITKVDSEVRFELVGLGGRCGDSGSASSGASVTSFTSETEGSRCRLDVLWDGPVVDARSLRQKVDEQIRDEGYDPEDIDISIDGIDVTVQGVTIVDGQMSTTPPTLPEWSAGLGIAGLSIAELGGTNTPVYLEVPRTFPMPDPAVNECEDAFRDARVVMGDGTASLLLSPADVSTLAARGAPALHFKIRAVVYATASKRII